MISRKATQDFLNRKLDSWDWLKSVDKKDIIKEIFDLWPNASFKTYEPMGHQYVSILVGMLNKGFCFFLDMGGGKTGIVLNLLRYHRTKKLWKKTLVVVPNEVSIQSWMKEIELFTDYKAVGLIGSKEKRFELLKEEVDLYIINYGGLQPMMTSFVKTSHRTNKKVRKLDTNLSEEFVSNFQAVVFDEIHYCKNRNTLNFTLCNELSKKMNIRYGLTGTPFGRDPMDLWAQFYLCDRGETLGSSTGPFSEAYFNKVPGFQGRIKLEFDQRKKFKFRQVLKHRSLRYVDKECNDLPGSKKIPIYLKMPPDSEAYYQQILKDYVENGRMTDTKEIANNFTKLRQIASGFLYLVNPETSEKIIINFPNNPKIDKLEELIDGIDEYKKIIIFCEFTESVKTVSDLLRKKKIGFVSITGDSKNPGELLKKFQDPHNLIRVMIANNKSGSTGLNLQIAKYMIFYETSVSPIIRKQAEKRSDRTGQTERVFIYDLIMKDSVEEKVHKYLEEGKDLFAALLDNKESLFFK